MSETRDFTPKDAADYFRRYGANAHLAIVAAARAGVTLAARYAVREHLSGQRLNRVKGNLQRSVTASPAVSESPGAVEGSFGTNVDYGVAHERGFQGPVAVREHVRAGATVRAHTRLVNIRARWYLRDAGEAVTPKVERVSERAMVLLAEKDGKPPKWAELVGGLG